MEAIAIASYTSIELDRTIEKKWRELCIIIHIFIINGNGADETGYDSVS